MFIINYLNIFVYTAYELSENYAEFLYLKSCIDFTQINLKGVPTDIIRCSELELALRKNLYFVHYLLNLNRAFDLLSTQEELVKVLYIILEIPIRANKGVILI